MLISSVRRGKQSENARLGRDNIANCVGRDIQPMSTRGKTKTIPKRCTMATATTTLTPPSVSALRMAGAMFRKQCDATKPCKVSRSCPSVVARADASSTGSRRHLRRGRTVLEKAATQPPATKDFPCWLRRGMLDLRMAIDETDETAWKWKVECVSNRRGPRASRARQRFPWARLAPTSLRLVAHKRLEANSK